jgi:uncharacterized SAM-binding protein YcdF (DUF218 family)
MGGNLHALIQPAVWLYLLTALSLASLWWKPQKSRRLLVFTILFVILSSLFTPAACYLALGSLEWQYPPLKERLEGVEAIVVLSGYVRVLDMEGKQVELGVDTLYRCIKAAEVYKQGKPCPVIASGGKVDFSSPGPPLAVSMRQFLLELGVRDNDIIVEDRSRTTYENAVETCQLLDERRLHRIVLVTDAAHLKRAAGCFRKQGVDVVPCGCNYRARGMNWSICSFLPDPSGAEGFRDAWHEWLGSAWYGLRGRT